MAQVERKNETKNEIVSFEEELQKRNITLPKNFSDTLYNTLSIHEQKGRLSFPKNYDLGNALTSAYLTIVQDDKLNMCDNQSIIQSMMDMATMGLTPSKKQCYFIPYGNKCKLSVSYHGKIASLKRIQGIIDIRADVIYKDTEYDLIVDDYGNDDIKVLKPCPLSLRKQENIEGAWCRIIMDKEIMGTDSYVTIMTIDDIKNAHAMGKAQGKSKAHNLFLNEMAKKSVINRCVKNYINTTNDDDLIIDSLNRTIETDYIQEKEHEKVYEEKIVDTSNIFDGVKMSKEEAYKNENIIIENQNIGDSSKEKVYETYSEEVLTETKPKQMQLDGFNDIEF